MAEKEVEFEYVAMTPMSRQNRQGKKGMKLLASASWVAKEQLLQVWPGGDHDGKHSPSQAESFMRPTYVTSRPGGIFWRHNKQEHSPRSGDSRASGCQQKLLAGVEMWFGGCESWSHCKGCDCNGVSVHWPHRGCSQPPLAAGPAHGSFISHSCQGREQQVKAGPAHCSQEAFSYACHPLRMSSTDLQLRAFMLGGQLSEPL